MKMNCHYKQIDENGVVTLHGCNAKPDLVPEEDIISYKKYEKLRAKFADAPENTFESVYYFDWETETYLPRERTHEEVIDWYVQIILIGTVTLDEIPQEYRAEVEARMPISEEQQWVNDIIAEVLADD